METGSRWDKLPLTRTLIYNMKQYGFVEYSLLFITNTE